MVDIFSHAGHAFSFFGTFDFAQFISWVLQSAGLFGVASMFVAGLLFTVWAKIAPGHVPTGMARNFITNLIPFAVVSAIYVVAVFTGHDFWSWSNYFDFVEVGFAAATGQALARILTGGSQNYMTLEDIIAFLKTQDEADVIAALEAAFGDLFNPPPAPPPPPPPPPAPGAPKGNA